ncbi:MAG: prepilin-type N-terminal cleavage/methylation domain-containing protein [Candidatus Pacebacteria bacterium]|nr:prepilin-type N-terminal cleavage/methylation domain-containing protein [Candidatus Paceibacterota bacterium]
MNFFKNKNSDQEKFTSTPFQKKDVGLQGKWGFTLIELLIVSAIFVTVTSIMMVRFSLFNNKILTTNLAYDIALSIRKAQTFGLNARGFDAPGGVTFDTGYGIHFDDSSKISYILFADLDGDKKYDPDELVESFSIGGGHFIEKFCATPAGSRESCSNSGGIGNLDIIFLRPDPDAFIKSYGSNATYQSGVITVISPQGVRRAIQVYSTGQISIVRNP